MTAPYASERGTRDATVDTLLRRGAARTPERPALECGDRVLTYAELERRVEALAGRLRARGVRRGHRVVIHMRKSIAEAAAILAVARAGALFVNLNAQCTPRQVRHVRADCDARALLTDARHERALQQAGLLAPPTAADGDVDGAVLRGFAAPEAPPAPPPFDDLAALLYTSGSTGLPKGVMVTHANLLRGARCVAGYLHNTAADRILGLLPLSFDYGLNQLLTALRAGATLVLQPVTMPAEIAATLERAAVTGMAGVPRTWVELARTLAAAPRRFPALRYITNSGGAIPRATLRALPRLFPGAAIHLMYGLTEAFRSTTLPPELFETKCGAIGRAVPGEAVYVVHPEGRLCAPGETGELVHRGGLISRGYWGRPDLTARLIRPCPCIADLAEDETVLFSGDRVRADPDGVLWFDGRADQTIKCSGFRISPAEVEDVILESGLADAAVAFGVADDTLGQAVHAAVAPLPGGAFAIAALEAYCRATLPAYMMPAAFHVWRGALPRTPNGKLDRAAVIRTCKDAESA
jgi:amino acid adenylation domain-containing protein